MSKMTHKFLLLSVFALGFLTLQACDLAQNHLKIDRDTNSEFQDYRDAFAPREAALEAKSSPEEIPPLESYVMEQDQNLKALPLVSVSVNQSIPLRDVLFEIAKQADYDIELDPRIQGSIIFTARNKPLDVVIDRIAEIAGLRYKFNDDSLRVELDTPFTKNYQVDFLNVSRKTSSSIAASGQLASAGGDSGGGGGGESENGSKFSIDSESEVDTWKELEDNLKQILESNSAPNFLRTPEDPSITSQAPVANDAVPPVPPVSEDQLNGSENVTSGMAVKRNVTGNGASNTVSQSALQYAQATVPGNISGQPAPVPPADATQTQADPSASASVDSSGAASAPTSADATPPTPVLEVGSLPTGSAGEANSVEFKPNYSINKQAGIISVYANQRIHQKVKDYIDLVQKALSSQVLIEAKVLEVSLSDQFAAGINWNLIPFKGSTLNFSLNSRRPTIEGATGTGGVLNLSDESPADLVEAISSFGTIHSLASPRLTVLNNQSAVLNVARNLVYFEVETDTTSNDNTTVTTSDSDIKTVPEGVLINVVPSIASDLNTITMTVRPTVSRRETSVADPVNAANLVPQMNIREFDSVLKMKSGETVVMGGLINDRSNSSQSGLPVLSETPVFGALFRNQGDQITKTELVVLIRATVLTKASDSIDNTDRDIYKLYSQDRRPFPIR